MYRLRQRLWPDHRHRKQQFAGVTVGHASAAVRRPVHFLTRTTTPKQKGEPSRAPLFLCSNLMFPCELRYETSTDFGALGQRLGSKQLFGSLICTESIQSRRASTSLHCFASSF